MVHVPSDFGRFFKDKDNEKLHILYSSPDITIKSRTLQWMGHVEIIMNIRNAYRILAGNHERKRPLGRARRRR
jgi:hypothetical protein